MVEVKTEFVDPGARAQARLKKFHDARRVPGVRVVPAAGEGFTEDDMRQLLKHPKAGGFRPEGDIEWPNDVFTQRRLKEGSIKLSEGTQDQPAGEVKKPVGSAGSSSGGGR
jgi:hypothetical protein